MVARLPNWLPAAFLVVLIGCAYAAYEFPDSHCSGDTECRYLTNTKCNDAGRCECLEAHTHMNASGCGRGIRDPCYDQHCDANNSYCVTDVCICRPPAKANHNGTFCYKPPQYYQDLCNSTNECPDFGDGRECNNGRCGCQDAFAFDSVTLLCKYKIDQVGKQCNQNQLCYLEKDGDDQHVQCIDNVCTCVGKLSKDKQSCSGAASLLASVSGFLIVFLARVLA